MTAATTVMPTRDATISDTFVRISGQGFPLVFVHGFTTTSEFWREQVEEFSKAYRVIRINLPGHGASPAPTSRSYCLEDFVEDVARVFRESLKSWPRASATAPSRLFQAPVISRCSKIRSHSTAF
jgi:pimeloyl-ACP methyl ester carboxylesterase